MSLENPKPQHCSVCNSTNKPKFLLCSACLSKPYCGPQCQRVDWPRHKIFCKHFKAARDSDDVQELIIHISDLTNFMVKQHNFPVVTEDPYSTRERLMLTKKALKKMEQITIVGFEKRWFQLNFEIGVADCYRRLGNFEESDAAFKVAIATSEQVDAAVSKFPGMGQARQELYSEYADLKAETKHVKMSEALRRKAIAYGEPFKNATLARDWADLALLIVERGAYDECLELLRKSFVLNKELGGTNCHTPDGFYMESTRILFLQKRYKECYDMCDEGIEFLQSRVPLNQEDEQATEAIMYHNKARCCLAKPELGNVQQSARMAIKRLQEAQQRASPFMAEHIQIIITDAKAEYGKYL